MDAQRDNETPAPPTPAQSAAALLAQSAEQGAPRRDVYFTSGYGRAAAVAEEGTWVSLDLDHGRFQLPLVVRTLASGRVDASSPYGYAGAYFDAKNSPFTTEQIWGLACTRLRDAGVVSLFLRANPLFDEVTRPPAAVPVVTDHTTYLVPTRSETDCWTQLRKRARNGVKLARKSGLTVELRSASPQDFQPTSPFRVLYSGTMERVGSSSFYKFHDAYFQELLAGLGSDCRIAIVRDAEGAAHASAMFLQSVEYVHYHLSGSDEIGMRQGASYLMILEVLNWMRDQELKGLHLGGGVSQGDGLDLFKSSFGGNPLSYNAYGLVVDPESYAIELAERAAQLGASADSLATSGFFPAYRRSTAPGSETEKEQHDD